MSDHDQLARVFPSEASIGTGTQSVADFYSGKSVFITGGTGFLGKPIIEKLLRCCPNLDKIYMLIREKKGECIDKRLKEYFDDPLFQTLKQTNPKAIGKLEGIPGDLLSANLGISAENELILTETVSVIIHTAASVRFNDPLKIAWMANVESTKRILELSRRIKRIEAFVHVSTAYSNVKRKIINEQLYPPPADINEVRKYIEQDLDEITTRNILNGYPNTYTFTKALTEHLVAENNSTVPSIIIRPSCVTAIKDGPIKGWLSNWNGPTGLATITSRGLNRVVRGRKCNILDMIPVDYVANLTIVAATKITRSNELKIYNSCSSACNPCTLVKLVAAFTSENIQQNTVSMPFASWYIYTNKRWLETIVHVTFQQLPAFLADIYMKIRGKTPKFLNISSIALKLRELLGFFASHSWVFNSDNVSALYNSLSPAEREMFPCDASDINWDDYLAEYCRGVIQFLEKKQECSKACSEAVLQ